MAALSFYDALGVDMLIWAVWSTLISVWAIRWPAGGLGADGWLTQLRPWERDGLVYANLGVRRWKARLPDLATLVGGRRKELVDRRDPDAWLELAAETRRAERAHWLILLALPLQLLVRGGVILVPMAVYAIVANGPCIAAQRYNRGRLGALRARRLERGGRRPPSPARSAILVGVTDKNVLGGDLEPCGTDPLTGFYRDGCCTTGPEDRGSHTICAVVTAEFLAHQRSIGNDLSTPMPVYGFPGLVPGDRWCVTAANWLRAHRDGAAAHVVLASTHERALEIVPLEALREHAVDVPDSPGDLLG